MYDQYLKIAYESCGMKIAEAADHMAMGGCKSYEEYKESVGMIAGLRTAQEDLVELDERMRKSSEDGIKDHLDETGNDDEAVGYT
jgi:hypothetical protein